ncbi:unnamed protein product [Lactuca saligna]|uniref:Uncharacterized protein n=1 Tax=Lactuca saligna TaxID=75948 RepID=A0AA35YUH7_LACSI|nr:unnamed protein product [Lactuca saligna]
MVGVGVLSLPYSLSQLGWYHFSFNPSLLCLSNLTSLSLKRNTNITTKGLSVLSGLVNLSKLDLIRCSGIHGGLVHLRDLVALLFLNVSRFNITDDGCDKFSKLKSLKALNLGFNDMSDAILSHLKGSINLESLNPDSCRIGYKGLVHLAGLVHLKCLELSDTEVGNNGLRHLFGLVNLESLNLSFTLITDGGLQHLAVKRIFALISQPLEDFKDLYYPSLLNGFHVWYKAFSPIIFILLEGLCFYYMPICFPETLVLLGSIAVKPQASGANSVAKTFSEFKHLLLVNKFNSKVSTFLCISSIRRQAYF